MHIHIKEAATSAGPSRKSTKRATSKAIGSRSTSGRDRKAQIQETARSLYDAGDYMGSFSDNEQDTLFRPLGKKDDIIHAEPKPWPPVRTTVGKTAPTMVTTVYAPVETSDEVTNQLFRDLMAVRNEV